LRKGHSVIVPEEGNLQINPVHPCDSELEATVVTFRDFMEERDAGQDISLAASQGA